MSAATGSTFDLAVIGGGPAGVTAALRAAELGARVTLVERDRPGGTCTDDGCAPTRVLAKAARLVRDAEQLADYGLRGPRSGVDLPALLAATQRTVYELHEKKQLEGHLEGAGVRLVAGRGLARFIGPNRVVVGDDMEVEAERFILACGGHARRLPFPGSELALTHNDVWTMGEQPGSLAIIGAAATGAQLASIFAAFGTRVTLFELAPRVIPAEDTDVAAALAAAFTANGIEIITGIGGVERIDRDGRGRRLAYRRGDEVASMIVDAVLLAVGWPGNLEGLGLEAAGVATERGYVTVDDTLRTSAEHIWAAGDITGRMMLVQSATYEGRIAAENALGTTARSLRHTIVAHGGFTDPEYGSVGLTEAAARDAGEVVIGLVPYADLDRAVIDRRTEGFCKLVVDRSSRRVVGAHVIGEQAVEVVQIAATAIAAEMPVERLAEIEFAYPTFTSIVALAARQVVHALRLGHGVEAWEAMGRPRLSEWERRDPRPMRTPSRLRSMFESVHVVGTGRAGGAIRSRLAERGLRVTDGRDPDPAAELVLLCVPDQVIGEVAAAVQIGPWVAHVSGATYLAALGRHERRFSVHPLQTLTRERGPEQLDGAWGAISGETEDALARARWLAETLGLRPFEVADADRTLYHAAAVIGGNFLVTLHDVAVRLLAEVGAPEEAIVPLMRRTIENRFDLTGPIARGDWTTVEAHLDVLAERAPNLVPLYRALAEATRR